MTEETLFEQAVQLPNAERMAFLNRECPDPVLRARVEALLAADAASRSPLDGPIESTRMFSEPAVTGSYRPAPTAEEAEGVVIAGRYKLRQQIGEGGMGTVWMADQTEPVKRKVAVKLIRVDRGQSRTILARFEAERQAIALMDHPHIAKLLDAGTTETGSPYFIMELVKGIPLNEFCDQQRLTITERLNLFTQICSAVQHAHQKGIIHRDLKPGNILVENHDGKPVPKVIDFGLAKATTGLQLTEQSMFTGFGAVMGTPLYMAPEQAGFNAIDVDTRADVYALGVILYELLTGTTPITRESFKKAAFDEMLRLVREQEAPTPSSRLSSCDNAPSVAASRQIEPTKLGRFVKGELDWIVLKALSKERDRRYESANGFAKDIERFLNHEPVQAGPPSASYRLRKFVRRHRGQVFAASLVVLALVTGVVGTTLAMVEAKRQQQLAMDAVRAEREASVRESQRAESERQALLGQERERRKSEAIASFVKQDLFSLLNSADQDHHRLEFERTTPWIELLNRAAGKLKLRTDLDPAIESELYWIMGMSYRAVNEPAKALPFLERVVALRTSYLGKDHTDTLNALQSVGFLHYLLDRPETAVTLLEEAYQLNKTKSGDDDRTTLSVRNLLGLAYLESNRVEVAIRHFEETLKQRKVAFGPDHPSTLTSMHNLALAYHRHGNYMPAIKLFEETLQHARVRYGRDDPETLVTLKWLGQCYLDAKQLPQAVSRLEELYQLNRAKSGPDAKATLTAQNLLGLALLEVNRTEEAVRHFEEGLRRRTALFGLDDYGTLTSMHNLALAFHRRGEYELAIRQFKETLEHTRKKYGRDHAETLFSQKWLDRCRQDAVSAFRQEVSRMEQAQPDSWATFRTMSLLGEALLGQKNYADAEPTLLKGYEGMKARERTIPPTDNTRIPEALDRLIELYTVTNKPDELKKYQELRATYAAPKNVSPQPEKK